jgi:hypothetical protein
MLSISQWRSKHVITRLTTTSCPAVLSHSLLLLCSAIPCSCFALPFAALCCASRVAGGIVQRFRALRPLVEATLEG